MELKNRIKKELSKVYGKFETGLEVEYETVVTNNLIFGNRRNREKWVTYNQVIIELKHNLKNMLKVKQLQYELTDNNNPNKVCISIIKGLDVTSNELDRLYDKIIDFKEKSI